MPHAAAGEPTWSSEVLLEPYFFFFLTFHLWTAGVKSVLPDASVARTWKVCFLPLLTLTL